MVKVRSILVSAAKSTHRSSSSLSEPKISSRFARAALSRARKIAVCKIAGCVRVPARDDRRREGCVVARWMACATD